MTVTSLHNPDQFLHTEEGDDATKHSKTNSDGVGYEVQKRVPKQTTTSERKEDLQKPLFFLTVVQGDEEQNEEWSCRDEEGCHDRVEPDRGARSFVILFIPVGMKFLSVHLSLLGTWFSLG